MKNQVVASSMLKMMTIYVATLNNQRVFSVHNQYPLVI